MKVRRILATVTAVAVAAVFGAPSATAQSQVLKAQIPFEFRAAGEVFPAGAYVLSKVNSGTLRLQDARGRGVFIPVDPAAVGTNEQNWYAFRQYGEHRFLAGAYWAGSSVAPKIRPSQEELVAQGRKPPRTIAVR